MMLTEVLNVIHFPKIDSATDKLRIMLELDLFTDFAKLSYLVNTSNATVF